MRIDVGTISRVGRTGKDIELLYICPYAAMFNTGLYCPYLHQQEEEGYWDYSRLYPREFRTCPKAGNDKNAICYKVREVKYVETVKHARLIGSDFVALDDIVDVKVGFIGGNGLWDQLGKRNQFAARVVEFGGMDITLDISTEFWSRQVEIPYGKIESIKRREAKCS